METELFEISVKIDPRPIIEKWCKEAVRMLNERSPEHLGRYKKAWTYKIFEEDGEWVGYVFNTRGIAHFLEYGRYAGTRWIAPQPHLEPTYNDIKDSFVADMRDIGIDVKERKK